MALEYVEVYRNDVFVESLECGQVHRDDGRASGYTVHRYSELRDVGRPGVR